MKNNQDSSIKNQELFFFPGDSSCWQSSKWIPAFYTGDILQDICPQRNNIFAKAAEYTHPKFDSPS